MKKIILSALICISVIIITLVTGAKITEYFYPPVIIPKNITDANNMAAYLFSHASLGYLLGRVIAGMMAGLLNGFIASKMKVSKMQAVVVASLFSSLTLYYMYLAVHPVWFWILLTGSFIPASMAGFSVGQRRPKKNHRIR